MSKKRMIISGICVVCLLLTACTSGTSKVQETSGIQVESDTGAAPVRHTETQAGTTGPADQSDNTQKPEERILMHNGTLYYGTAETGPMGDSGAVSGRISSSVGPEEIPAEDGQSNFGCIDNPYTGDYGDGFIMVFVDEEWYCFYTEEALEAR